MVLLINPWIFDFAAYDFWVKPLGLLYCASLLRKNGHEVYLINCLEDSGKRSSCGTGPFLKVQVEKPEVLREIPRRYSRYGISPEEFEQRLDEVPAPEVILVTSMMTYWYPGVFQVIAICKRHFPSVPVILGGIYATLCAAHARKYSGADFYISGEGEASVLTMVSELTSRNPVFVPEPNELDSLPYPAFDLLNRQDSLCLLTTRGCPYHCPYCASARLNFRLRQRKVPCVLDEIEYWISTYQVQHIAFYDDAFLYLRDQRTIPLLKGIVQRRINCTFHTPNGLHIRGINPDVAELLFQAGFKTIRLGLETSNQARQKELGNKVNNDEFRRAVKFLQEAGYQPDEIGVYLLVGLPGQTTEEVRESIQFVKDCGARPHLAEYSPVPGTGLWREAVLASPFDIENEPLFHNNSILPCRSAELDWDDLYYLKREVKPLPPGARKKQG